MPATSDELLLYLSQNGIQATTAEHPAVHTVEESQRLRGDIPGRHTKNLFLRDSKKNFFLAVMDEASTVDLKALRSRIGARGNLSFGTPEMLMELLGVTPGSVSLLGLINDKDNRLTVVIERRLLDADTINCHPLTNQRTTSLSPAQVMSFLALTGHAPLTVSLEKEAGAIPPTAASA
jgi:Ala-tRNA(Pro) deacylase